MISHWIKHIDSDVPGNIIPVLYRHMNVTLRIHQHRKKETFYDNLL